MVRGRIKLAIIVVAVFVALGVATPFAADLVVKQMLEQRGFSWKTVKRNGLSWRFRDFSHPLLNASSARFTLSTKPELKLQNATLDVRALLSSPWQASSASPAWLYVAADPLTLNWGEAEIGSGIRGRLSGGRAVASGPTLRITGSVAETLSLRAEGDIAMGPIKFDGRIDLRDTQPLTLEVNGDKLVMAGERIGPDPLVLTKLKTTLTGSAGELSGEFTLDDLPGTVTIACGQADDTPCDIAVSIAPAPAQAVMAQLRGLSKTLAKAELSGDVGGEVKIGVRSGELDLKLSLDSLTAKRTRIRPARLNGAEFFHYVTTEAGRRIEWRLSDDADEWTAGDDIAPVMKQALMASTDPNFDVSPALQAERLTITMKALYAGEEPGFDGRTLTQALVDRLRRKGADSSLARQIVTGIQALELKQALGSERVMELLLNVLEWAPDVHGITRAAEYYFEKEPSDLGAHEAAFLALVARDPFTLHEQWFESRQPDRRVIKRLLEVMLKQGWMDEEDFEEARLTPFDWEQ